MGLLRSSPSGSRIRSVSRSTPPCPRCGDAVARPADERGLCPACFVETVALVDVPAEIEVSQCGNCDSIAVDGAWRDDHEGPVQAAIEAMTDRVGVHRSVGSVDWTVRADRIDALHHRLTARFELEVAGRAVDRERETVVSIEGTTCPRCSRIEGDEYGGIVQLRANGRVPTADERRLARTTVASVLDDRVGRGDRESFLTDVIVRDEGLDFRLSTPRLGDQVASAIREELGGRIDTSRTLVTTDGDGREVYRVTFSVRLPRFRPGDVVEFDAGVGLVQTADGALTVRDLTTGESSTLDPERVEGPVATAADAAQATIVAALDDRAVQVIHPETNEAVTVARYPGVDLDGETVRALPVGDRLFLLPSDAR